MIKTKKQLEKEIHDLEIELRELIEKDKLTSKVLRPLFFASEHNQNLKGGII